MSWLDILLAIPLVYGFVMGCKRGFVKEVIGVVAVVIGIYIAKFMASAFSLFLQSSFEVPERVSAPLSYFLIVVIVVGGLYLLAWMLTKILKAMKLGTANRVFGGIFGLLKFVLLVSVILNFIMIIDHFVPIRNKPAVQNSLLYSPLEGVMVYAAPFLDASKSLIHDGQSAE
ncbi:MAG: CvpA family protein [Paludibacteraceae bacterium]|nr:CvpA family protein [Paludibacteraceae bacterium]